MRLPILSLFNKQYKNTYFSVTVEFLIYQHEINTKQFRKWIGTK